MGAVPFFLVNREADSATSLSVSGCGFAITAFATGRLIALAAAVSTACVTAETEPRTISVTSLPPSFLSHVTSSTSAVLHRMSSASIAAVTPVLPENPEEGKW